MYLAYLPVDPKAFQQCGYETYFVNDSNYYLFFNYMNRTNNSWTSRYNGIIEPNTKIFLEEFGKPELNDQGRNLKPILILNQHLVLSTDSECKSSK